MRAHLWAVFTVVPCLLGLSWANGEAWETVLRDSNTGVLVPTRRTPVRIEREQLQITLLDNRWRSYYNPKEPYGFQVRATYYLHNPTSQPQRLTVAFPIPYPALFTETPVLLDGRPLEWRYFDPYEVFRWHRNELAAHLERWLNKHPNLRATLVRAYEWWRANPSRRQTDAQRRDALPASIEADLPAYTFPKEAVSQRLLRRALDEIASKRSSYAKTANTENYENYDDFRNGDYLDWLWTVYLFAQKEHDFITESAINFLLSTGYTPSLAKQWEISHKFLEPSSKSLHAPPGRASEWVTPASWEVSVLMFEFSLAPHSRAQLTVRYAHPVGIHYSRSALGEVYQSHHHYGYAEPIWHFTYVLKVRPTWAYFGPVEVTFRIPESLRLRASPRLGFAGREAGWRIYHATLQPYRQNLYAVVAPEYHFRPKLWLNPSQATILRYLEPGRLYLPVQELKYLSLYGEPVFADVKKVSTTTIDLSAQFGDKRVPIRLRVGSRKAYVDAKEVRLSAPVKRRDNQAWISVRALVELLNTLQGKVSVEYDSQSGWVIIHKGRH